jgi:hypothetical protein
MAGFQVIMYGRFCVFTEAREDGVNPFRVRATHSISSP